MPETQAIVPAERIEGAILMIRGQKVLLDTHLAGFYGVTVSRLNEAVKRNRDRFPDDFMFRLSRAEFDELRRQSGTSNLKSQIAISSSQWGGRRQPPYAFTEQGVAMLSSVLRSKRAIRVNLEIMRAFVRLRRVLAVNAELARRLDDLEQRVGQHDEQFAAVIQAIRELMQPPATTKRKPIGYQTEADR
ncbi:MAG TPA: ORF6N domain-containing protein [Phycisphaerae bacterium]